MTSLLPIPLRSPNNSHLPPLAVFLTQIHTYLRVLGKPAQSVFVCMFLGLTTGYWITKWHALPWGRPTLFFPSSLSFSWWCVNTCLVHPGDNILSLKMTVS